MKALFLSIVIFAISILYGQESGNYYIKSKLGTYLDVKDANPNLRATIWTWKKNGSDGQKWRLIPAEELGYFYIQSHLGTYLDIKESNKGLKATVWTWSLNKGNGQKWKFEKKNNSENSYYIKSALGTYLDIKEANPNTRATVWTWKKNGSLGQLWTLENIDKKVAQKKFNIETSYWSLAHNGNNTFLLKQNLSSCIFRGKMYLLEGNNLWTKSQHGNYNDFKKEPATNLPNLKEPKIFVFKNQLYVIGQDLSMKINIYKSPLGVNWTKVPSNIPEFYEWPLSPLVFNRKIWILDKRKKHIANSSDGINWNNLPDTKFDENGNGYSFVSFKNKMFVIGGEDWENKKSGKIYFSGDGIRWNKIDDAPFMIDGSAVVHDEYLWLIGGKLREKVFYSKNGKDWDKFYSGSEKFRMVTAQSLGKYILIVWNSYKNWKDEQVSGKIQILKTEKINNTPFE